LKFPLEPQLKCKSIIIRNISINLRPRKSQNQLLIQSLPRPRISKLLKSQLILRPSQRRTNITKLLIRKLKIRPRKIAKTRKEKIRRNLLTMLPLNRLLLRITLSRLPIKLELRKNMLR
jgi:hypothetical protein